uniref:Uncharacterized protein n=1 Tax=Coccidioides posadasii RMSCC 3488 TaxID=454284 RepID=A0A0J6F575_COCPO|nr:hypothetical protein CPAG_00802 [Coccidioides posadasii RMSCC 3488]
MSQGLSRNTEHPLKCRPLIRLSSVPTMLWRTISTAILIFACHRVATRDDDVDKLVDSQTLKDPYPHTFTIFQTE